MQRLEDKENEIKLDILKSLSRSQRALATIIENIADITASSEAVSRGLLENIEVIGRYQRVLTIKLTGLRIRKRKKGRPSAPWMNRLIVKN